MKATIESFTKLTTWQKAHTLVLLIYRFTKTFPKEELYALTDQMRRCVVSISSNIAEGFSRKSYKEKAQFYSISLGSVTELQNQLLIARDLGYLANNDFQLPAQLTVELTKMINGLIKGARVYMK